MPTAPQIASDSWVKTGEWVETVFESPFVTVTANTAVYSRTDLRAEVEALVPEGTDYAPHGLFTTGLEFAPPPPPGIPTKRLFRMAGNYASREFEASLSADGLANVEQTDSRDLRLSGSLTGKAYRYDAAYPVAGDVSDSLPVRVWMILWPTEASFAMGGGIYPLDTAPNGLRAEPAADRRELFDRIRDVAQ
ncbi:hypothetical protein [Halovenus marina]|uniref:hypothetical protein n=1 Tax=Halovenus marina TaxID=3396621 RepID=UPI003F55C497